jgi:MFS family permease
MSLVRRALRHVLIDIGPLRRHRDFRLLFLGQMATFLGSMLSYVAIPYQVYALTGSSLTVGLLGLAELVPVLTLGLLGGALADVIDRRRLVLLTELALMAMSGALAWNSTFTHPSVVLIFAVSVVAAGAWSLQRPALDALLPRLVEREELTAAGALSTFQVTVGMLAGPAIGGVLVAAVGLAGTYAIDVATFAVSLALLGAMQAVPPPADAKRVSLSAIGDGLRYARSRPELLGTYLVDMSAMFFGMPQALFPQIAKSFGGAGVLGLLYCAPAAGALLASATSGWCNHVSRHGRAVAFAAAAWGLGTIAFGLADSLWLVLVFLAVAGGADAISGIFRRVMWNETIPDELRGRLASIEMISFSSGPLLGNVEAGGVASLAGVRFSIVSGGVLCVVGAAACAVLLPAFWLYNAPRSASSSSSSESSLR